MRLLSFTIILLFLSLINTACDTSKDKQLILGHWTGVEWLVDGGPSSYAPGDAAFTFDHADQYSFTYADHQEKGKYYISNHQLFTTPEGGIKMMVKVIRLTADTMVFDMNRGGQAERLTLVRR